MIINRIEIKSLDRIPQNVDFRDPKISIINKINKITIRMTTVTKMNFILFIYVKKAGLH